MRTLSFEAREERRRQVIGLRRRGWTYAAIAEQTGLSRTGVFNICQRYAQHGACALKDKGSGRKLGEGHKTRGQVFQDHMIMKDLTPSARNDPKRSQKSPQRVMRYFRHQPVRYAA